MNIHEFWKAVLVQDENEIGICGGKYDSTCR